jgi:hypothetical protein
VERITQQHLEIQQGLKMLLVLQSLKLVKLSISFFEKMTLYRFAMNSLQRQRKPCESLGYFGILPQVSVPSPFGDRRKVL